ncbi:MAG: class I SAM-dependent methyltransferase [Deltaproteobacteria bacterium]|nr:class I SAM-dependent methyltransferase [Deltaproteobacteria bacterium]
MNNANSTQIDAWNGRVGEKWAKLHVRLDEMLSAATVALKAKVGPVAGERVLDIGCGNGETCAIWLEGGAEVTGVDVSTPMLAVAASLTGGKATLIHADASIWKGEALFDLAVSRFGVMFFSDPVAAFTTIASNLRPGGRLVFACWRAAIENAWVSVPLHAVSDLLPVAPPPVPHAPGPFGLCDRPRLEGILQRAGFSDVTIEPLDLPVYFAREGGVEAAVSFAMQVGPTGAALGEMSKEVNAVAAERLKEALAPHARDGVVTLGGAIWMVQASAGTNVLAE